MPDRYDTTGNPEGEYYPGTSIKESLKRVQFRL
jgi:hypothetical protein